MRRRPTSTRLVAALRNLAALVALLLVAAQLARVGHHVLVAHYLCAVHGSLHHGDAPVARATEHASTETAQPSSAEDHGSHDDCAFPARSPEEAVAVHGPGACVTAAPTTAAATTFAPRAAGSSIPLLALAPKLSPPRA